MNMKVVKSLFSKRKIMRNTQGAISIFLAILMVPFTTIAGSLVGATRVNSASSVFDEAISNASNSTLANWDSFLKNRFGLLATEQKNSEEKTNEALNATFYRYLNNNLGSLNNTFFDVESNCSGMYSLADTDVLLYQIMEYSKYSVPVQLVLEGIDINSIIKKLESMIPGHNILNVITSGVNVGSSLVDLGNASIAYADAADETNTAKTNYDSSYSALEDCLARIASKISEKAQVVSDYESQISSKKAEISTKEATVSSNNEKSNKLNQKLGKYEDLKLKLETLDDNKVTSLSSEVKDSAKILISEGLLESSIDPENITVSDFLERIEDKIEDVEDELDDLSGSSASKELSTAKNQLSNLENELSRKKAEYDAAIDALYSEALTDKTTYVTSIQEFINKLSSEKSIRTRYDSAKASAVSSFGSLATSTITTLSKADTDKLNNQKKEAEKRQAELQTSYNNGEISREEYQQAIQSAQIEIDFCDSAINNTNNNTTKVNALVGTGLKTGVEALGDNFEEYTEAHYDSVISRLETLKGKVESFDVYGVGGSFSKSSFKSNYYISSISLVTREMVEAAEKELLAELTSDSIWSVVKSLIEVLKSLLKMLIPYDPNLNSDIDSDYYSNFDWSNLKTGNTDDKALSEIYKDLFGSYSATDIGSDDNFDFVGAIITIFENLNYISNNIAFSAVKSLFDFGKSWQDIENKIEDTKTQFKKIIDWAANIVETVYEKTLLAGYLSNCTSCRTTYKTGKSLTGASFNLRGQTSNLAKAADEIDGIGGFLTMIKSAVVGETAKCFVGAETEYLINGKDSEIGNQLLSALEIYAIRLICNCYAIASSPEVASIAAATTIGAPIIYILYILLEPLVDVVLLTNGGSVSLVKGGPYLVPSGFASLFTAFTGLTASNAQINSKVQQFEDSVNKFSEKQSYVADPNQFDTIKSTQKNNFTSKLAFSFNYEDYLFFFLMFCSTEKLLNNFRDIVQMEAVQNMYVKNGESGWDDINFDLARSYTYLRAEASFSTNEFISLSGGNINMKKRLLYRGY